MEYFIKRENLELWDIIMEGSKITSTTNDKVNDTILNDKDGNIKLIQKNSKANKLLIYEIGSNVYNIIFSCTTITEMWDTLQITHEGTS